MEPLLEVKNITKRFGGLTAVDDVNMKIFPGEVVGILGDNGADFWCLSCRGRSDIF